MQQIDTKKELTEKQAKFIADKISSNLSITKLCEMHGINRSTYSRWTHQKAFSDGIKEARDIYHKQLVDTAEMKIGELAEKGNITALIFILKSLGGWVETSGIDVDMKTPVIVVKDEKQKEAIESLAKRFTKE